MPFCSNSLGDKHLGEDEFSSAYDCDKYIREIGFTPYIFVKQTRIFRKITNRVDTHFARSKYDKGIYRPQYGVWPEKRSVVRVAHHIYHEYCMEIIEFLQNHPHGIAPGGGIIEPDIFSSTILDNDTEERYTIFTFLNKEFAAEFKLIWG